MKQPTYGCIIWSRNACLCASFCCSSIDFCSSDNRLTLASLNSNSTFLGMPHIISLYESSPLKSASVVSINPEFWSDRFRYSSSDCMSEKPGHP